MKPDIVSKKEVAMSITEITSKINKPGSYNRVVNDPVHGRCQRKTIKKEFQNLKRYQTQKYKKLPPRQKTIESKWVFKVKYHPDEFVASFKARLVIQEFSQVPNINFCKIFVLNVKRKLLQIYLALCLALNLFIYQANIVEAYLESLLNDNELPIFMKLLPGVHKFRQI